MPEKSETNPTCSDSDFGGGLLVGIASSVALICLVSAIWRSTDLLGVAHEMFSTYGTILAGVGAITAAAITVQTMRWQIDEQRRQVNDERREIKLQAYRTTANELQAGALELLNAALILQLRYRILKKFDDLGLDISKLTSEQRAGISKPPPLSASARLAMSHLRGSIASRALRHVDEIARKPDTVAQVLAVELAQARAALVNAVEAYLYLSATSKLHDTLAEGRRRGKVVIEGEEFFSFFKEIAAEGALDFELVEACFEEVGHKPLWKDRASKSSEA